MAGNPQRDIVPQLFSIVNSIRLTEQAEKFSLFQVLCSSRSRLLPCSQLTARHLHEFFNSVITCMTVQLQRSIYADVIYKFYSGVANGINRQRVPCVHVHNLCESVATEGRMSFFGAGLGSAFTIQHSQEDWCVLDNCTEARNGSNSSDCTTVDQPGSYCARIFHFTLPETQ